jgi:predicted adenine nucleotide alpha hydrolase (AANH) superfamily ATPase
MVLLHICCGICASWAIEKLKADGHQITGFFFNPNIYPPAEYMRRLAVALQVCKEHGIILVEGQYEPVQWALEVSGFEKEPEGGARCLKCYEMRLLKTAQRAKELGMEFITTTLTISPHKDAAVINKIGKSVAPGVFLEYNFKKEEGFKKANEFAKDHNLYRQHYCGCEYSLQEATKRSDKKEST